jgi:hypothetical protein
VVSNFNKVDDLRYVLYFGSDLLNLIDFGLFSKLRLALVTL